MNDDQLLRYARHIMLPEIDVEGQESLLKATVLIIGLGGLGSPVSLYLAASGIGSLVLADHDIVEKSNLQRQIVHTTNSIGTPKALSAKSTLESINPDISIRAITEKLTLPALEQEIQAADIVVDCTDNFETRYAINNACLRTKTKLVSGAAIRMEGQLMAIDPANPKSPCYQCLYHSPTQTAANCSETGIAAPVVGTIGTLQALEVIKLLIGVGVSLVGYVLTFDAKYQEWQKLKLPRNPDCPACGAHRNYAENSPDA